MNTKILSAGIALLAFAAVSFKSLSGDSGQRTEEYAIVSVVGEGKKVAITISREDDGPARPGLKESDDDTSPNSKNKKSNASKDSNTLLKTLGDLNKEGFELVDSNSDVAITGDGTKITSEKHQTFILRKKLK